MDLQLMLSGSGQILTSPSRQDPFATYSASTNALVQLTTGGKVPFLVYYDPKSTTSGGTWNTIFKIPVATFSSSISDTGTSGSGLFGAVVASGGIQAFCWVSLGWSPVEVFEI